MACICPSNITTFCGKGIVEHSLCLLPAADLNGVTTPVTIADINPSDPNQIIIEYVACGLIIVCGKYTKTVHGNNGDQSQQLPFQFSIEDPNIEDLERIHYAITSVQVNSVCSQFTCQQLNSGGIGTGFYYKLKEKDVISVQIKFTPPTA